MAATRHMKKNHRSYRLKTAICKPYLVASQTPLKILRLGNCFKPFEFTKKYVRDTSLKIEQFYILLMATDISFLL